MTSQIFKTRKPIHMTSVTKKILSVTKSETTFMTSQIFKTRKPIHMTSVTKKILKILSLLPAIRSIAEYGRVLFAVFCSAVRLQISRQR